MLFTLNISPIFNRWLGKETRLSFERPYLRVKEMGLRVQGGQQEAGIAAPPFSRHFSPSQCFSKRLEQTFPGDKA